MRNGHSIAHACDDVTTHHASLRCKVSFGFIPGSRNGCALSCHAAHAGALQMDTSGPPGFGGGDWSARGSAAEQRLWRSRVADDDIPYDPLNAHRGNGNGQHQRRPRGGQLQHQQQQRRRMSDDEPPEPTFMVEVEPAYPQKRMHEGQVAPGQEVWVVEEGENDAIETENDAVEADNNALEGEGEEEGGDDAAAEGDGTEADDLPYAEEMAKVGPGCHTFTSPLQITPPPLVHRSPRLPFPPLVHQSPRLPFSTHFFFLRCPPRCHKPGTLDSVNTFA